LKTRSIKEKYEQMKTSAEDEVLKNSISVRGHKQEG